MSIRCRKNCPSNRRGAILFLAMLFTLVLLAFAVFATDVGYLMVARTQLQATADAAAFAAAWELIDEDSAPGSASQSAIEANVRETGAEYASYQHVIGLHPELGESDLEVGYMDDNSDSGGSLDTSGDYPSNAVRVIARRDEGQNGQIQMLFARIFGFEKADLRAEATAKVDSNFSGFKMPADGSNLDILPFALDEPTWNDLLNGNGDDDWTYDPQSQHVFSGSDGILEVNLYPKGNGSPGNRGTVDIGSSNNSTADISRQIVSGVSASDLAYHGGKLELNENGVLYLGADTGISAGVKDELASIIGEPKIIPIFSSVSGNGNNAEYAIVKFAGVRIVDVKLTGNKNSKRVLIQPANVVTKGGITSSSNSGGATTTSYFIYSPPRIAR